MHTLLQGLILGFVIVLPGMSGGTVFILLGIYQKVITDISRLNIKPYFPMGLGLLVGVFIGGTIFSMVFSTYRDLTAIFLLGCLLASIRAVFKTRPQINYRRVLFLVVGLVIGLLMSGEPMGYIDPGRTINPVLLVVGGAVSTATMLIPGVPGSSILIFLGIYDDMLFYVKTLSVINLAIFSMGSVVGVVFLARILEKMYEKHEAPIAYFFAGLIAGSGRTLLPQTFGYLHTLLFIVGFSFVWWWSSKIIVEKPSNK